jgi:hypothetical protein
VDVHEDKEKSGEWTTTISVGEFTYSSPAAGPALQCDVQRCRTKSRFEIQSAEEAKFREGVTVDAPFQFVCGPTKKELSERIESRKAWPGNREMRRQDGHQGKCILQKVILFWDEASKTIRRILQFAKSLCGQSKAWMETFCSICTRSSRMNSSFVGEQLTMTSQYLPDAIPA